MNYGVDDGIVNLPGVEKYPAMPRLKNVNVS